MNLDEVGADDNIQGKYFFPANKHYSYYDNQCKEINKSIISLAGGYLWHKDRFKVFLPIYNNQEDQLLYLTSNTSFGDNIEDEWFIVYIILELSKQYKGLVVQLKDSDGDFLLIEAADYLPPWANPDTTENRVFICNNHIHLIPPEVFSLDDKLTLQNAVELVTQCQDQTRVSTDIENAILSRVGNYAEKIKENTHMAAVRVPLEIAAVLKLKPDLIAPIVNTYCHQDIIDAKACKNVYLNKWTTMAVKFSKCLYAMLLYTKHNNKHMNRTATDKPTDLGIKLTHGFQIIMDKSSDIYNSKEYAKFLHSLKENGYFQNNIEGSKEYKKLLQKAKDFFADIECPVMSSVAKEIAEMMTTDEYIKLKSTLQDETTREPYLVSDDDDDWLTIHPEQLNNLLNSRYGKKLKFRKGDVVTPDAFTTELNEFLKQTSDFEGIETNNAHFPDNSIDFDSDQFVKCVDKMLNLLSSSNDNEDTESLDSYFSDGVISENSDDEELSKEIKGRLIGEAENRCNNETILENIIKGLKEENASAGPSSNLISSVGLDKSALLDSDDD